MIGLGSGGNTAMGGTRTEWDALPGSCGSGVPGEGGENCFSVSCANRVRFHLLDRKVGWWPSWLPWGGRAVLTPWWVTASRSLACQFWKRVRDIRMEIWATTSLVHENAHASANRPLTEAWCSFRVRPVCESHVCFSPRVYPCSFRLAIVWSLWR